MNQLLENDRTGNKVTADNVQSLPRVFHWTGRSACWPPSPSAVSKNHGFPQETETSLKHGVACNIRPPWGHHCWRDGAVTYRGLQIIWVLLIHVQSLVCLKEWIKETQCNNVTYSCFIRNKKNLQIYQTCLSLTDRLGLTRLPESEQVKFIIELYYK